MGISIAIDLNQVTCINSVPNQLDTYVHLNKIWDFIQSQYNYIFIKINLQIPTIDEVTHLQTTTEIDITQSFKVSEIIGQEVHLAMNYPGTLDVQNPEREIRATATVTGYNVIPYIPN